MRAVGELGRRASTGDCFLGRAHRAPLPTSLHNNKPSAARKEGPRGLWYGGHRPALAARVHPADRGSVQARSTHHPIYFTIPSRPIPSHPFLQKTIAEAIIFKAGPCEPGYYQATPKAPCTLCEEGYFCPGGKLGKRTPVSGNDDGEGRDE